MKARAGAASAIVVMPPDEWVYGGTVQFGTAAPVCPGRCVAARTRARVSGAKLVHRRFFEAAAIAPANPRLFIDPPSSAGRLRPQTALGNSERLSELLLFHVAVTIWN